MRRAVAVTAVGLVASACGSTGGASAQQGRPLPRASLVLDERTGAYRGLGIGSTSRGVRRRLGRPERGGPGFTPPGVDYYEVGGPTFLRSPPGLACRGTGGALRYRAVSWLVACGRVHAVFTVEPGARTRGGVAIGDDQDRVRERYPGAECLTANEGGEYPEFPLCEVVVRPGLRLFFGADPVASITLAATGDRAYRALARQRR